MMLAALHLLHETARQRSGVAPRMLLPVPLHPAPHRHEEQENADRHARAGPPQPLQRDAGEQVSKRNRYDTLGRSRSSPSTGERPGRPPGSGGTSGPGSGACFARRLTAPAVAEGRGTSPKRPLEHRDVAAASLERLLEIRGHRRGDGCIEKIRKYAVTIAPATKQRSASVRPRSGCIMRVQTPGGRGRSPSADTHADDGERKRDRCDHQRSDATRRRESCRAPHRHGDPGERGDIVDRKVRERDESLVEVSAVVPEAVYSPKAFPPSSRRPPASPSR